MQLAPYPEVQKLVAEGDVSYHDALVMVGLDKPDGHGAFGGYEPEIEEIAKEKEEYLYPSIRGAKKKRAKPIENRKHAGTLFCMYCRAYQFPKHNPYSR